MKCSSCGKEFGDGTTCQYCGVDRVIGGASFSGYQMPSNISTAAHGTGEPAHVYQSETNTICVYCGEVIPADAKFCPFCAKELYAKCPKCGHTYSSKYPVCPQCGTNREKFQAELIAREEERKRKAEAERLEKKRAEEMRQAWLEEKQREEMRQAWLEEKRREDERREKLAQQKKEKERQRLETERAFADVRQSSIYNVMHQYLTKLNNYLVDNKFSGEYAGLKGVPWILFIFIVSLAPVIIMALLEGTFQIDDITIIFGILSIVNTTLGIILYNRKVNINDLTIQLQKSIISEYIEKNPPSSELLLRAISSIKENLSSFKITEKYTNKTLDEDIIYALSSKKIPIACKDGSVLRWN